MPVSMTKKLEAGQLHPTPFVGPIDHPATVTVDVSQAGSALIDEHGYLKPGMLLARSGRRVPRGHVLRAPVNIAAGTNAGTYKVAGFNWMDVDIIQAKQAADNVAFSANTTYGAGKFGAVTIGIAQGGGLVSVSSPAYGSEADAVRNVPAVNGTTHTPIGHIIILSPAVTLNTTALSPGVNCRFTEYAPRDDQGFGAVVEAVKVAKSNSASDLAAAEDIDVVVAPICMLNRAILEDSMGTALSVGETYNIRDSIVLMNAS